MARRFQQFSIELELGTFNAGDAVSTGAFHHRILGVRRRSRCRAMKRPSLRNGSSGWSTLANRDRASRCHFWHPGRVLLTWADTLALSLVNPMRQLDASDRIAALANDLKPSMKAQPRLIARWQVCDQCLTKESLCRPNASIGSEQKVDGLAPLVDDSSARSGV